MEEDEVEDAWIGSLRGLVCVNQDVFVFVTNSPFNTSRTVVVSAKISRKYSGGVLRGSIPDRQRACGSKLRGYPSPEDKGELTECSGVLVDCSGWDHGRE